LRIKKRSKGKETLFSDGKFVLAGVASQSSRKTNPKE